MFTPVQYVVRVVSYAWRIRKLIVKHILKEILKIPAPMLFQVRLQGIAKKMIVNCVTPQMLPEHLISDASGAVQGLSRLPVSERPLFTYQGR